MSENTTRLIDHRHRYFVDDIRDFHEKFEIADGPESYLERHAGMRQIALLEELNELSTAFAAGNLVNYLDALVDLDYFAIGTIFLLGQQDVMRQEQAAVRIIYHLSKDAHRGHTLSAPQPPLPSQYVFLLGNIYANLGVAFHSVMMAGRGGDPLQYFTKAAQALVEVHRTIVDHAHLCGLDFAEAWDRVHAANMKKKRASKPSDSKRGSKYDVIKPEGWAPPDLTDLVGQVVELPTIFRPAEA